MRLLLGELVEWLNDGCNLSISISESLALSGRKKAVMALKRMMVSKTTRMTMKVMTTTTNIDLLP